MESDTAQRLRTLGAHLAEHCDVQPGDCSLARDLRGLLAAAVGALGEALELAGTPLGADALPPAPTFHHEPHPELPGVVTPVLDQEIRMDPATGAADWDDPSDAEQEQEPAETERCGWLVQRSGLHGGQLVRVTGDDVWFYLDAAMYDALDDEAFATIAQAKAKAALLGVPSGAPLPAFDVEPDQEGAAEAALAAFRELKQAQARGTQGVADQPTFAFEEA